MVRRGLKTTVIATVMAMMLAPSFSAFAQTGKSNTSGSWQVENNAWVFRNAEGQSVKGWVVYNQEWYYLNPENGQLKTGWLQLDGKWYFLSTESGAQQGRLLTGWQWIDGYCYYLMPTDDSNYGVLVVNGRTPDGYFVNQSGQWLHGENGDAVYEAGKGLPSAASSQQVAGASRALPGQVLGASRAIAAPGGGSFGGGGGGGSTGGGATASTTGGAGTATTGTATTGTSTAGTSTGTATGGSAAGTAGTAGESATVGGATGASTGTEANATTGAESNASGSTGETTGTTTPSTEKPGETVTPGTSENTTQPGGNTTETPGTENGGNTEKPGTENGGNTEKPVETETPGNSGTSENTNQPGGTTEKPGTENSGNTTEKPGETENSGNSENTTQPGGNTENSGTETGGTTTEKPGETETSGTSENTTQPGGTTEKPGTENGGNNAEKLGETVTPGTSENTTQPGGTTEEKPGTENGGTTTEKPGETENSGNSENTTQPGGNTEEKPGVETGGNVEEGKKEEEGLAWPANFTIDYNSDKKCFVLTFEKESHPDEINKFLQNDIKIFVTSPENKTTEYSLGNPKQNLMRAGNIFCHDLIGEDKKSYRFNALNISRAAFEPGDNKVQIQVEGYATKEFICQVSKQQLEDGIAGLKDFGKLETSIDDDNRTGVYRVKLVSIKNLTEEQEKILENLDTLYVDDVEYHKVKVNTNQDLCQIGPPSFMLLKEGNGFSFAIGNPPKEMGSHSITIQPKDYKDIKLSYVQKEEQLVKAPEVLELKLNSGKKYYQLSFKGDDRVSKYSYLNAIKSFMVAGQTYTRMGSFHPELLNMGAKYILDDSTNAKAFEDILLFSVPTANGDKKQEILIEAEGYEVATIPLS
ncbi:hypothetical protein [Oribacterium sinus]